MNPTQSTTYPSNQPRHPVCSAVDNFHVDELPQERGKATPWLDGKHTIFGKVADDASKAVVDAIATTPTRPGDRPVQDVVIDSITVED